MGNLPRPCLDCGAISTNGTRCPTCQQVADSKRNTARTHYHGDYQRRARIVRDNATTCWLCHKGPIPGDPWQADHVIPGDPTSLLLPAHRSCNARRGNQHATPPNTSNQPPLAG